jgi:hypothetical protein
MCMMVSTANTAPRGIDVLNNAVDTRASLLDRFRPKVFSEPGGPYIHSYLSMTSRMHYFSDRVLPPECTFLNSRLTCDGDFLPG